MVSMLKDLMYKDNCYAIGIRERKQNEGLLFEGNVSPFTIMPISTEEWYADPVVFSRNGVDYLFCEVYDRKTDTGSIGYTILDSTTPKRPQIVLKTDSHLSYPCVFEKDDCIYMIPETTTQKDIELYKAVDFPKKWDFVCRLKSGGEYADSTVLIDEEHQILLTFEQFEGDGSITKLHVYDASNIENGELKDYPCKKNFDFMNNSRAAGSLFQNRRGGYYRPTQLCAPEYGYALNFMKVDLEDGYDEQIISTVYPESVRSDFHKKIIGIHTYALTDRYEIIDIKFDDPKLRYQIRRVYRYFLRKVLKR